ncbi:MAG: suppressor of fused domain protein [Lachnospiraceae bacterium]|nr:suppressor of fused domain protein [Lachnospiraceae bacterium]
MFGKKKKSTEPVVLLESWSPSCEIQAFVEESDTCCYFYLWFHPGRENAHVKSCWICNVGKSPDKLDTDAMKNGMAPPMPKEYVKHDAGGIRLNQEKLNVIWFEEGDAAALLEGDKLLCVIPGWSGEYDFSGYSRYAVGMAPYAWELAQAENVLLERVHKSREFWNYLEGEFWGQVQQMHMETLENFFGKHEQYFAIDGRKFPPKALISGSKDGVCYGITAGVSLLPMPQVEQYFQDETSDFRRIELGFAATEEKRDICMNMYSYISSISNIPWREISFLGHGHTVPCQVIDGFSAVWLLDSRLLSQIDAPVYPDFMKDKINLLWLVPLKEEEYQKVMEIGTEEALKLLQGSMERLHVFDGNGKF